MMTKQQLGGRACAAKTAPLSCPRCGKTYKFQTPYMAHLGHLGLHGLADKYFGGDIQAAQKHLRENGIAKTDPMPYNGAFRPYIPVKEVR